MNEKPDSAKCRLFFLTANTSMDFGLLLLRIGISLMMLVHGIPKLGMLFSGHWENFPDPVNTGSFAALVMCIGAEVGGSLLILLGLFTRLAALVLLINMCVALFLVLGLSGWSAEESAALYLLIYITLFYTGAGAYSLDATWLRRRCALRS